MISEDPQKVKMPVIQCPITDCPFATEDVEAVIAASLLNLHATEHSNTSHTVTPMKVEKVKRPTLSLAGINEDWSYFTSRWTEYKEATHITGREVSIQLLECCDEELQKYLTRTAGRQTAWSANLKRTSWRR